LSTDTALRLTCGVITAVLAGIAVIAAGKPEDFGIGPVAGHWLTVVAAVLGIIAGGLPGWVKGAALGTARWLAVEKNAR
jgi:hypothetical protein